MVGIFDATELIKESRTNAITFVTSNEQFATSTLPFLQFPLTAHLQVMYLPASDYYEQFGISFKLSTFNLFKPQLHHFPYPTSIPFCTTSSTTTATRQQSTVISDGSSTLGFESQKFPKKKTPIPGKENRENPLAPFTTRQIKPSI